MTIATSKHEIRLEDYRPTDFVISTVDLAFDLDPQRTVVTSTIAMARRPGVDEDAPLTLDGDEVEFVSLKINGVDAEPHAVLPDRLEIRGLPAAGEFTIEIVTAIAPASNTKLMGLYSTNGVYCTQCEAEGFRRITYFPDRPDVLAVYTTTIRADANAAPLLLSNGNPVDSGPLDNGRHFVTWNDPHPKPSYLFALVAGDLGAVEDSFTTASGRKVKLAIYVEHGKEERAAYAMDALKRSMRWDEERFGREYDLDIFMIVAVSDFNMGAMENKGLNVFNDKYVLADPDTATDADYANIEAIIAHEYFHNWTGNRITCRDWFQLCLKEGLTVYRDHEFSADMRSRAVKRIAEVRLLKAHQFPEDSGPLAHPVRPRKYSEINNFYTATVYEKGSEVVRMIETLLGRDDFKKGMDLYFERHDGDAATIEDFVACFAEVSGKDLDQFFLWYEQAGTPEITIASQYEPATRTLRLELEQSIPPTPGQPSKQPMHIPLRVGLFESNGEPASPTSIEGIEADGDVLNLRERSHTVRITGVNSQPAISVNRSFSAPVNVRQQQSDRELAQLARIETDLFSRWQALNELAMRHLVSAAGENGTGQTTPANRELTDCLFSVLADRSLEPAFRAHAITLPGETDIAREIGNDINPDAIHEARETLVAYIAIQGRELFEEIAAETRPAGDYSPDAASAGDRALYLACMSHLAVASGDPSGPLSLYRSADNMTLLSGALAMLAHRFAGAPEAEEALADFEARYRDNPLVIDKWLTVQATIPGPDALMRVKTLMDTPHFQLSNPNRVRSLIGAYGSGNPTGFNLADGKGYDFLAGIVTNLDPLNPQVAARLLTAMRSWRSLEPIRREKALDALRTIAGVENLSTDVRDIVDRMIGDD